MSANQLATADREAHRGRLRRSAIQDRAPVHAARVNIRAQHLLRQRGHGGQRSGTADDVISAARADVCDGHPVFDAK